MESTFRSLVLLAILALGSGQQTTTFVPKSACGVAAQKCYNDQQSAMDSKFDATDFAGGCQIFKSILDCMYNSGTCTADVDYTVVRQSVIDEQAGVCGVDGSLQSCGYDIKECFTEMDAAMADTLSKNFSQACPLINQFAVCADQVNRLKECSPVLTDKLNEIKQILNTDRQVIGCDGPCAQAIAICTANATTFPTDQSVLSVDVTSYCQSSYRVYNCLNNITKTSICTGSAGGIDASSYLQAIAQNTLSKVGDVCDADGTPSDCVNDLVQCASDLMFLTNSSALNKDSVCQASSEFLECISKLPCMTTLGPLVNNFRSQVETAEIELLCPSVGSCNERFAKCGIQDQGLANITQSNEDTVCTTARNGLACFDFVKNDPYCINERNSYITEEQDLNRIINIECGDNQSGGSGRGGRRRNDASNLVPLSLHLWAAATIVSLKLYF